MFKSGELIKICRIQAGLTQGELAFKAKTTQSYLSAVECNRVIPRVDAFERILNECGYEIGIRSKV